MPIRTDSSYEQRTGRSRAPCLSGFPHSVGWADHGGEAETQGGRDDAGGSTSYRRAYADRSASTRVPLAPRRTGIPHPDSKLRSRHPLAQQDVLEQRPASRIGMVPSHCIPLGDATRVTLSVRMHVWRPDWCVPGARAQPPPSAAARRPGPQVRGRAVPGLRRVRSANVVRNEVVRSVATPQRAA
jgi:hypothetical protein